jgi:hypothetical protein
MFYLVREPDEILRVCPSGPELAWIGWTVRKVANTRVRNHRTKLLCRITAIVVTLVQVTTTL